MEMPYEAAQTGRAIRYVAKNYAVEPEFLWENPRYRTTSICRNPRNRKWFAVILPVAGAKLGLESGLVEAIDLRFDKGCARDFAESTAGIYPGYHMNKSNWITIALSDSLPDAAIFELIDHSYRIVDEGK